MIPELGQFALSLALVVALVQGSGLFLGTAAVLGRSCAQAQAVMIAFAFGCLVYAFVTDDFSVQYVAFNSNSALPLAYRVAGAWGGHEGSLLLWCLMLGVWMTAVSLFSAHLPEDMVARVLGVLGLVSAGFLESQAPSLDAQPTPAGSSPAPRGRRWASSGSARS